MLGEIQTRKTDKEERNLDMIERLANRLGAVTDRLDGFLARFHGGIPKGEQEGPAPVPVGYFGQIGRLDKLISEIEDQANSITNIG